MRRMMILSFAIAGACASGTSQPASAASTPVAIYTSPETGTLFADRPNASAVTIAAEPTAVWAAVKKVYGDLEIPVTVENRATHQIGNSNIVKSRQMAGSLMTAWLNCGGGVTGDKANEFRIYASLLTEVVPDANAGTSLRTILAATARDVEGGTTSRIACTSTGRLEQTVLDRVKSALVKP
jgi:hypothetical protein